MFQGCFKGSCTEGSGVLQDGFKGVSGKIEGGFEGALRGGIKIENRENLGQCPNWA